MYRIKKHDRERRRATDVRAAEQKPNEVESPWEEKPRRSGAHHEQEPRRSFIETRRTYMVAATVRLGDLLPKDIENRRGHEQSDRRELTADGVVRLLDAAAEFLQQPAIRKLVCEADP